MFPRWVRQLVRGYWLLLVTLLATAAHARVQDDRGHTVVCGGHRFVGHPMYTSLIMLSFGIALTLGSWAAAVPAVLISALLVLRTSLDDRMLTAHLSGSREYTDQVRARLVTGLW